MMKSTSKRRMSPLPSGLTIALLTCVMGALPLAPVEAQSNLQNLVRQSTFIFRGTVTKLRAVTMPVIPVSENTIVVRVNEVLHGEKFLKGYTDKEITVYVKEPAALKVTEQAIFFTQGWVLGDGVAVREVGRLKAEGVTDLRMQITTAAERIADQDLQNRIAGADLVVVGRVSDVRAMVRPGRPGTVSEHDPRWQEAILEVGAVLKGDVSLKRTAVVFPGSLDVAWFHVPKFSAAQEGIWILRGNAEIEAYTALDPLDFQPKDQLGRIKELTKRAKELAPK